MKIKIEGGSELFADAISYIKDNKKIIMKAKDVPAKSFYTEPEELRKCYWWVSDETNKKWILRIFDEEGNLAEVKMDFDKIYNTKNDHLFDGLTEKSDINQQKKNKFVDELKKNEYQWVAGSPLVSAANQAIQNYREKSSK